MSSNLPQLVESSLFKQIQTTTGNVLIATKSIPISTTLLTESPLITTSSLPPYNQNEEHKLPHEVIASRTLILLQNMMEEEKQLFWNLKTVPNFSSIEAQGNLNLTEFNLMRAQGVIVANTFSLDNSQNVMIYPTYSQMRHSCVPNSCVLYDEETSKIKIRSMKPINKNQEITISRLDSVYKIREVRQGELALKGIFCRCPACSLTEEKLRSSDERRRRLKDYPEVVEDDWLKFGRSTGDDVLKEFHSIFQDLELEGISDVEEKGRAYYWDFVTKVGAAHHESAITSYCAKFASDAYKIRLGDPNEKSEMFLKIAQDPTSHPIWSHSNCGKIPFDPSGKGEAYKLYGIESPVVNVTKKKKNKNKKKKNNTKSKVDDAIEKGNDLEDIDKEQESFTRNLKHELEPKTSPTTQSMNSSLTVSQSSTPDLLPPTTTSDFNPALSNSSLVSSYPSQIQDIVNAISATSGAQVIMINTDKMENSSEKELPNEFKDVLDSLVAQMNLSNSNSITTGSFNSSPSFNQLESLESLTRRIAAASIRLPSSNNSTVTSTASESSATSNSVTTDSHADNNYLKIEESSQKTSDESRVKIEKARAKASKKKKEKKILEMEKVEIIEGGSVVEVREVEESRSIEINPSSSASTKLGVSTSPTPSAISTQIPCILNISTNQVPTLIDYRLNMSPINQTTKPIVFSPGLPRSAVSAYFPKLTTSGPPELNYSPPSNNLVDSSPWKLPNSNHSKPVETKVQTWNTLPTSAPTLTSFAHNTSTHTSSNHTFSTQINNMNPDHAIKTTPPKSVTPLHLSDISSTPPSASKLPTVIQDLQGKVIYPVSKDFDRATGWTLERDWELRKVQEGIGGGEKFSTFSEKSINQDLPSSQKLEFEKWKAPNLNKASNNLVIDSKVPGPVLPTFLFTPPTSPEYPTFPSISANLPPPPKPVVPSMKPQTYNSNLIAIASCIHHHHPKVQTVLRENLKRVSSYPERLPLEHTWILLFSDSNRSGPIRRKIEHYQLDQIELFKASTVESLCVGLKSLALKIDSNEGPLTKLKDGTSLSFFREGIEPVWEDTWNRRGGRILYFPSKSKSLDQIFLNLLFSIAGGSLAYRIKIRMSTLAEEGNIVGIVASKRASGNRIEIWIAGSRPEIFVGSEWLRVLKEVLAKDLELDGTDWLEYKKNVK